MPKTQTILVSVTNDLVVDQRVHKVCTFLHQHGFQVVLIGRKLPDSLPVVRDYECKRLNLVFKKGVLFYAFFNLRLFFFLLFKKADALLANDLDTLWPNYLVSKIKGIKLYYDSHEYFTEVPELIERPKVRNFWLRIEKRIFPKLKHVYTVNETLAKIYSEKYKVEVKSVMNLPFYEELFPCKKNDTFTVIYQGALNKDRGLEEVIEAFTEIENMQLWLLGDGDLSGELKNLTKKLEIEDKITFFGKLPFEKLRFYTLQAHLGVSLEKGTNLNYKVASPNKLFDYISAGIPVLTCELPEIKKIVDNYEVGSTIAEVNAKNIAKKLNWMYQNPNKMAFWTEQTKSAAKELCWENQLGVLEEIYL